MKEGNFGDGDCFLFNLNKDSRLEPIHRERPECGLNQWKRFDGIGLGGTD